ncbi:MAG TPA: sigma-54 dependent transcriptional regulator [Spirochaetia bacterium]|nr:sigma-54 dependent transcriptional regulator [Spirochaetia bacterium]
MKLHNPERPVLMVDDEPTFLEIMAAGLERVGITNVVRITDSSEARRLIEAQEFSAITLDLYMPGITGFDLLPVALQAWPATPVIMVSSADKLDVAVGCMRDGAFDYILKPVDHHRLTTSVSHALERWETSREITSLKEHLISGSLAHPEAFAGIVTGDPAMVGLFRYAEAIAPTSLPVLVTGETGVGKELMARAIHALSGRKGSFLAVNVAGLDDALFADTLFGHLKGAFTSADSTREGMVAKAERGTLFLDEIGDLAPESQIKLLRLLQEGEYYPLGSDRPSASSARYIFATNIDLAQATKERRFRQDLMYRLGSHRMAIPPLRERRGDLPLLVEHILDKAARTIPMEKPKAPDRLFAILRGYGFPGNVRELEGILMDAVVRGKDGGVSLESVRSAVGAETAGIPDGSVSPEPGGNLFSSMPTLPTIKQAISVLVDEALLRSGGNQTQAAALLGISRPALTKRLSRR